VGRVLGWTGDDPTVLGSGPSGFARLEVDGPGAGSGSATFLAGIPLADGTSMDVGIDRVDPQVVDVHFTRAGLDAIQPIRIELAGVRPARAVPGANVSVRADASLAHGVAVYVVVGPSANDLGPHAGGAWLLEVFDDGSPLVWLRLPESELTDDNMVRHLTVGPDGSVYLMLAERDGMHLLRRGP